MTTFEAAVIAVFWYALWGAAGYMNGRWYIQRQLTLAAPVPKSEHTSVASMLAFAYLFASVAPLLYPPFLDAATQSSPLFYSLPVVIALSLFPALLKFHAANELAERRKRHADNVAQLPVDRERRRQQSKAG